MVLTSIQVIHCGSEQDVNALKYLKHQIKECEKTTNKVNILHLTFREEQTPFKSMLIYLKVDKCKKSNSFVIILLSKAMFEIMWLSKEKREFLSRITLMRNCLHLWVDVDIYTVRRFSTTLLREDLNFGRIHIDDLNKNHENADERLSKVIELLHTSRNRTNFQQNYAVDVLNPV